MATPKLHITLSGGYWLHSYRRLLQDLSPLLELQQPAVVTVDMRKLTFLGPAALATTAATIMKARDSGLTLDGGEIRLPRADGIRRYLHRMDFFRVLFHEPDAVDSAVRGSPSGLVECRNFTTDAELRPVAVAMLDAIAAKTSLDQSAGYALDTCLSEMLENVMFHAYTPHGGVAAVQAFKQELELAIVDLGVGIPDSLARNPVYESLARQDDLTAIKTALVANVTSTPERNQGWGLAFTEILLGLNGGRLIVRSGAGHVIRGAKNADRLEDVRLPGTLVAMRIKVGQPLDYSRAWDLLDEVAADGTVETL